MSARDGEGPASEPHAVVQFHARLIGVFALTDSTGSDRLPALRKTRALIARILLAEGQSISRQALIDLAWRGREPEQGRASLRQALYEVRDLASGDAPLLFASRDTIRANPSVLTTDLDLLKAAADADDLGTLAASLKGGLPPLLTDLDGISPAIDDWLGVERAAHRARLAAALAAALERAPERGQSVAAAALRPALRDLAPDGGLPGVSAGLEASIAPRKARRRRAAVLAVGAALVALAGAAVALRSSGLTHGRLMDVEPLAAASSDAPAQTVRQGLSGELAHALGGNPADVTVEQVGQSNIRLARPDLVVSGDVATIANRLQAHVQLRNAHGGAILWANDFIGDPSHPDVVREQIATTADAVINCALSARHGQKAAISDEANRLYLTACDFIEQYRLDEALAPLRQVVALEPGFARAWADLATTEAFTNNNVDPVRRAEAYGEAAAHARKALAIDPNTGLAYYALAQTMPGISNWQRRVDIIARGLKVEPSGSELNNAMAQELARVGRSREAITYFRRSMAADPLGPVKTATLFVALANDGQKDEAERLIDRALQLWPRNAVIWNSAFSVELRVGDLDRAEAMLNSPDRLGVRDAGEVQRARRWLDLRRQPNAQMIGDKVKSTLAAAADDPREDPLPGALNIARFGQIGTAYRLVLAPSVVMDENNDKLMFDDGLDAFRADPRFMVLAARRGLTPIWQATRAWPDFCSALRRPACGNPSAAAGS